MVVIESQYAQFQEIDHLNTNFIPGIHKMRLTIDTISSEDNYRRAYPAIVKQFVHLFPRLKQHSCCYSKIGQSDLIHGDSIPMIHEGNCILDIIHIVEHVIIDLQCSLSGMKMCSGITCNYKEPRTRYDIFVECIDQKVGLSAALTAVEMVQKILACDYMKYPFDEFISVNDLLREQTPEQIQLNSIVESCEPYLFDFGKDLIRRMLNFSVSKN